MTQRTAAPKSATTHECQYTVEWSPRGDRGVVRHYKRTAEMHEMAWQNVDGHWYLRCIRCHELADVQS